MIDKMKKVKLKNSIIVNGNAIEVLKSMIKAGKKVDMIFTDPPYRITARGSCGNAGGMFRKEEVNNGKVFRNNDINIEEWLPLFYDVLKDDSHCYLMTNNKNIVHYLSVIEKSKFHFVKCLIWVKNNKIMGQCYMSQFEYIIMLRKGKHKKINNCGTSDVLYIDNKKLQINGKNAHETESQLN